MGVVAAVAVGVAAVVGRAVATCRRDRLGRDAKWRSVPISNGDAVRSTRPRSGPCPIRTDRADRSL